MFLPGKIRAVVLFVCVPVVWQAAQPFVALLGRSARENAGCCRKKSSCCCKDHKSGNPEALLSAKEGCPRACVVSAGIFGAGYFPFPGPASIGPDPDSSNICKPQRRLGNTAS